MTLLPARAGRPGAARGLLHAGIDTEDIGQAGGTQYLADLLQEMRSCPSGAVISRAVYEEFAAGAAEIVPAGGCANHVGRI